jgi:cytochrome c553
MKAVCANSSAKLLSRMAAVAVISFATAASAGWTPLPPWQQIEDIANRRCNSCHGAGGVGTNPLFPKLAGQNADYLSRQMQNFRSGLRKGPVMYYQLSDLTTENVAALAKYYSALPRPAVLSGQNRLEAVGKEIFGRGIEDRGMPACARCHGDDGRGSGVMPRLAAQHASYIAAQLQHFQEGTRAAGQTPEHPVADALSDEETLAVSRYIATLP